MRIPTPMVDRDPQRIQAQIPSTSRTAVGPQEQVRLERLSRTAVQNNTVVAGFDSLVLLVVAKHLTGNVAQWVQPPPTLS